MLDALESPDQLRQVVAVQRPEVAQAELLKDRAGNQQVFGRALQMADPALQAPARDRHPQQGTAAKGLEAVVTLR